MRVRERERIDLGLSGDVDVVELKRGAKELKKTHAWRGNLLINSLFSWYSCQDHVETY